IQNYEHLFQRSPLLAIVFVASVLSLAGMPLTAGFIAKIYLALAGAGAALWTMVILLVINSGIGLYYYIRVITGVFKTHDAPEKIRVPFLSGIAMVVILFAIVWIGVAPGGFLYLLVP
ncbi:MAG: proton-conducting transporter membrane subunit, partial [Bacteroidales bacterium]